MLSIHKPLIADTLLDMQPDSYQILHMSGLLPDMQFDTLRNLDTLFDMMAGIEFDMHLDMLSGNQLCLGIRSDTLADTVSDMLLGKPSDTQPHLDTQFGTHPDKRFDMLPGMQFDILRYLGKQFDKLVDIAIDMQVDIVPDKYLDRLLGKQPDRLFGTQLYLDTLPDKSADILFDKSIGTLLDKPQIDKPSDKLSDTLVDKHFDRKFDNQLNPDTLFGKKADILFGIPSDILTDTLQYNLMGIRQGRKQSYQTNAPF